MKGELFWTKTVYFHDCGKKKGSHHTYLAGFKSPHKGKNYVMDSMMNIHLEKENTKLYLDSS